MALKDFKALVQSLSPAMARLLLRGHVETLDSYGRATTITPGTAGIGLTWRRDKKGYYLGQGKSLTAGGGSLSVADAAELRVMSGTLFWTARNFQAVAADINHEIISKEDAGGIHLRCYLGDANRISLYDGSAASAMIHTSISGAHSLAVRLVSGGKPDLFSDGVWRVQGTANITPTGDDAPVYLSNSYVGIRGSHRNDFGAFLWFSDAILGRAITDQEISELHDAWESIGSVFTPKRTISLPRKATEIVATAPLLHLAGERNAAGLLLDLSGNGRNGTISGRVTQTKGPEGVRQVAHGAGDPLIITASDAALNPGSMTVELRIKRNGRGQANAGVWFAVNDNVTARMELFDNGPAVLAIGETYADGEAYWTFPLPTVTLKAVVHLLVRYNRDLPGTLPYVLVDGEAVTVTALVAKTGARLANAAPRTSFLGRGAVDLDADGCLIDGKVYNVLLTDAECRALYVDHALSDVRRLANRTDYPVSVAAVTAAGRAGPWKWLSGSISWSDDGTRRRLLANAGSYFAGQDSTGVAYGARYYRFKFITNTVIYFPAFGSVETLPSGATFNGYIFWTHPDTSFRLYKYTAGVSALLSFSTPALANNVEYEVFITRRQRDGLFTVWLRGGVYSVWTSIFSFADTTFSASNALVGFLDGGGYIADVTFIPNGGTLLPTEIPFLMGGA